MPKIILDQPIQQIFKGKEVFKVKAGGLVIIHHTPTRCNHKGEILLRTTCAAAPLVNLETGELWGNAIDYYSFLELNITSITLK